MGGCVGIHSCQRTGTLMISSHAFHANSFFNILFTLSFIAGHKICPPLEILKHGFTHGEQFWEGKHVSFNCKPGLRLSGSSERRCLQDGTWTGHQPRCILQGNENTSCSY